MFDPYSSCPCGSGKKFKWCCQPIHQEISTAFRQDEQGQHETALRLMDQVVAQHPDNPEAWGKKALLLFQNEKPEEAEAALTKALEVNPNYPFGQFLRGRFRLFEGEIAGALILFRKAAELYDPDAHHILMEIYLNIFDCEMKLNRPVAARAAGQLALKADPNNVQLRESLDGVFSAQNPNLPEAAKKQYAFQPTRKVRPEVWPQALARANNSKLNDVQHAFAELAKADPEDPNVWYNLALTDAWLGDNGRAVEALEKVVALESDESRAAEAWTLAEVLRVGQGMEDQADYVEHSIMVPLRDPQSFVNGLSQLEKAGRIGGMRFDRENGILMGFLLEPAPASILPEQESRQVQGIGAFFMLVSGVVRMWNVQQEKVEASFKVLRDALAPTFGEPHPARGPAKFNDILAPGLAIPVKAGSKEEHEQLLRDHFARYFEETWLHRPLRSLGNVPPIDAVGSPVLRRKVLGIIAFFQQIATMNDANAGYDFDRLRRKLGLIAGAAASASAETSLDIASLSAADLAGLQADTLDEHQLEQAFQTAVQLDAKDLAGKFAERLVSRPASADRPDRYPWFSHLVNQSIASGDFEAALNHVNDGERHDCEHNEGRRRNDYELRRGQILVKQGDHDQAEGVFQRLIDRVPGEMKYRGTATESLLSARQGKRALKFAEAALAHARQQNNRDSEQYFLELADAAKRQS